MPTQVASPGLVRLARIALVVFGGAFIFVPNYAYATAAVGRSGFALGLALTGGICGGLLILIGVLRLGFRR